MKTWKDCKHVLCIRPDNLGDVLMSSPAMRALKESFGCRITLLTSSAGATIAEFLPEVDETIVWDVSWVKRSHGAKQSDYWQMVEQIRSREFDGAVIFTVFSQNPLPSVMLAALAGIPLRLAYCRENPYELLTDWVPDEEPYTFIRHQVQRDLDLVASVGATASDNRLRVRLLRSGHEAVYKKLSDSGIDHTRPWVVLHPGVSESKREYPVSRWIETGKQIRSRLGYQLVLTGAAKELPLCEDIRSGIGTDAYSLAGMFSLAELIALINEAPLLITVNTGPAHIAAAVETPVVVLYALTNPQHAPWRAFGAVLPFSPPKALESRNEVLRYVSRKYFPHTLSVDPEEIVRAAGDVLLKKPAKIPELVTLESSAAYGMRNTLNFQEP